MMRPGLFALLLLAIAGSVPGQTPPTIVLSGSDAGLPQLQTLEKSVRKALAALESNPPADAALAESKKKALQNELDALARAAALLKRVGGAAAESTSLQQAYDAARKALTELQLKTKEPIEYASVSEEELNNLTAEANTATSEQTSKSATAKAAEEAVVQRTKAFSDNAAITAKDTALTEVRKALEGVTDPEAKEDAERTVRIAELGLRILEVARDHHAELLRLDTLTRDLRKIESDTAAEAARWATAKLEKAREVRAAGLDAEAKEQARIEQQKLEEAKGASPAKRGVLLIEALVAAFQGAEREESARLVRVRTIVARTNGALERVRRRNGVIEKLFPDGSGLDGWKIEALKDEQRRLRAAERLLDTSVHRQVTTLATDVRAWFRERDRLREFRDLFERMEETRHPEVITEFLVSGLDKDQDALGSAWLAIYAESDEQGRKWFEEDYLTGRGRLKVVVDKRITALDELDAETTRLFAIHEELDDEIEWRRRHLESVSLWLRSPPPFSSEEIAATREEIADATDSLGDTATHLGDSWERWRDVRTGPFALSLLVGLWTLLALVGGPVLGRRLRRTPLLRRARSELDTISSTLRLVVAVCAGTLPSLMLLAGATWLVLVGTQEDPVAWGVLAATATWWMWRASGCLACALFGRKDEEGLIECGSNTAESARRVMLVVSRSVALLLPVGLLLQATGHPRLGLWVFLVLGTICVLAAAVLVARRDALLLLVSKEGGLLARTFRALLPYAWPVAVAFYAGVIVMTVMGYRNAAWHYGSRFLLCAAALVAGAVLYQILLAILKRRLGPQTEAERRMLQSPHDRVTPRLLAFRILGTVALFVVAAATVVMVSLILAIGQADWSDIANTKLLALDEDAPLRLGDVAKAAAVFIVGLTLAGWIRDGLRVAMADKMQRGSRYVVRTLVFYTLVAVSIMMAFGALGLNLDQLGWFLAAAGVGIGFGLQEVISNFIAGLILFFERPVQVGDIITVSEIEGDVTRINIRSTEVRTRDGISIIIPNKRFITDNVVNWSHGDQRTRLRVNVGVAYGSDVPLVKRVLLEVASAHGRVMSHPAPEVNFRQFGDSELSFELMVWLVNPDPTLRRHVTTELNSAIDAAFREHDIQIPFPQRDLHLRSTPDGSDVLSAELGATAED